VFLLLLPLLVIFPTVECQPDIVLLPLFRSTAKKDRNLLAAFSKIHSVAGAKSDLAFKNTSTDTL